MTDKKCTCADTTQALNEEILSLHRQLAHEKLRADAGWERYESANIDRNTVRATLAAIEGDTDDFEEAILAVKESLVEMGTGWTHPVLAVINGGNKND